ncbi:MAG: hypothetical protein QNJ46_06015 [Leptolyngbyaceae cyanobacterium MO_188.B28]|nr:hypothetical protein [Leptolyngbyaceae cyanobacterium MO_188.B28]
MGSIAKPQTPLKLLLQMTAEQREDYISLPDSEKKCLLAQLKKNRNITFEQWLENVADTAKELKVFGQDPKKEEKNGKIVFANYFNSLQRGNRFTTDTAFEACINRGFTGKHDTIKNYICTFVRNGLARTDGHMNTGAKKRCCVYVKL